MSAERKTCMECNVTQEPTEFHANAHRQGGLHSLYEKRDPLDAFISRSLLTAEYIAEQRDLRFDITINTVHTLLNQQEGKCRFTLIEMTHQPGSEDSISINRIDPTRGYTSDNVQLVCKWVHRMKGNLSDSKFIENCRIIVEQWCTPKALAESEL